MTVFFNFLAHLGESPHALLFASIGMALLVALGGLVWWATPVIGHLLAGLSYAVLAMSTLFYCIVLIPTFGDAMSGVGHHSWFVLPLSTLLYVTAFLLIIIFGIAFNVLLFSPPKEDPHESR